MRKDHILRQQVRSAAAVGGLTEVFQQNGFIIELRHLVVAMADCMEELEQQCISEKTRLHKNLIYSARAPHLRCPRRPD